MVEEICPYLGIEEDAETAVAFPSPRNRCFRSGTPAAVADLHQDGYCLRNAYAQCPVFLLKAQALPASRPAPAKPAPRPPTPIQARPAVSPTPTPPRTARQIPAQPPGPVKPASKTRRVRDSVITGLMGGGVMAILLAAILILPAYGPHLFGRQMSEEMITMTVDPRQAGLISQPTPFLPADTDTPTPTFTSSPTFTRTPVKPTMTSTRKPAQTITSVREVGPTVTAQTGYCGVPYGWTRYIIQPGDTLTSLSQRTNVSVYQLQSANCMGSSTLLYAGMTIYVPFIPEPVYPTHIPPTNTIKPSPAPPTSTAVPTNTVEPSATIEPPPTVAPVVPSATPVTPAPDTTITTPVEPEHGGVN